MDLFVIIMVLVVAIAAMFLYVTRRLNELHLSMNSRLDLLLLKTEQLARAEGFKAGQASEHANDESDATRS